MESVYQLIPEMQKRNEKPSMYRSKHNYKTPPTFSTFGFHGTSKVTRNVAGEFEENDAKCHPRRKKFATFGRLVSKELTPQSFLHKTDRSLPEPAKHSRPTTEPVKPPIPSRSEKPLMGLATDKNFVVANAVENILAVPKKPANETLAVERKTFGRIPKYLETVKRELNDRYSTIDKEKEAADAKRQRMVGDKELFPLPADEVAELKEGLQARWAAMNKQFSTMSFNLETRSQLRRKEQLEAELRQLERAIQRVSKTHIFVYNE